MKILRTLLVAVPLITAPWLRAETDQTANSYNGRAWRTFSIEQKLGWLGGYRDGLQVGLVAACGSQQPSGCLETAHNKLIPTGLTNQEVIEWIDDFYAPPENRLIPVWDALGTLCGKTNGDSTQETERKIDRSRATWATRSQGK